MDINNLIRTHLKKCAAYEPGEQPTEEGWVKLNTNENPFPPLPEVIEDIKNALNDKLKKYPDPTAFEVRKMVLSVLLRDDDTLTNRNSIFIGNGSDDVLDVICKVFINPGDEVITFSPSYGMYKVLTDHYDGKIKEIKLNEDFTMPDLAYSAKGKLFFICSPNNPTGRSFGNAAILKICSSFPGIVVVDEAYADFSDHNSLSLLKKVKNLIVTRTFSKSFSLASLRFAYALADASIIKEMNKVKLPYNTSYIAQVAALSCIKNRQKIIERNKIIISERQRLSDELDKLEGIEVFPSDANFIFIKFKDKPKAMQFENDLKTVKILVRHFNKQGLYEYLRISVGSEAENNKLLFAMKELASKYL